MTYGTRRTTAKIAAELNGLGIEVCPKTVARILRQLGFSLRLIHKKLSRSDPERDERFLYVAEQRERFANAGQPIAAIDMKKKDLIDYFKNPGCAWSKDRDAVGTAGTGVLVCFSCPNDRPT